MGLYLQLCFVTSKSEAETNVNYQESTRASEQVWSQSSYKINKFLV